MERRHFLKSLGALGVTLGFGSRVVSREADRLSDAVVQEGVKHGWYSQETADEFIKDDSRVFLPEHDNIPFAPEFVESTKPTYRDGPLFSLIEHDWSRELAVLLDRDLQVMEVPYGNKLQVPIPLTLTLRRLNEGESVMYSESDVTVVTHDFDRMYCAFIIRDREAYRLSTTEVADVFFFPAMHALKKFISEECDGKRLAVQRLPLPVEGLGVYARVSSGGPIPIRTTAMYDMALAGMRINFEFMVKAY